MKPKQAAPQPRTLVQIVRVAWGKDARGGSAAALRSRAPSVFAFDAASFDMSEVVWIEQHGCYPLGPAATSRFTSGSGFHFQALALRHLGHETSLALAWNWECGAPERHFSARIGLREGEWARLRWNGRDGGTAGGGDGAWSYQLVTLNVARVRGDFAPDIFTATEPTRTFESLAILR